jgi:hypothetical protein
MSKSRPKVYGHKKFNDYDEYDYIDRRELNQRRDQKRMKNMLRSKNIDGLLELDHDDYDEDYKWRR